MRLRPYLLAIGLLLCALPQPAMSAQAEERALAPAARAIGAAQVQRSEAGFQRLGDRSVRAAQVHAEAGRGFVDRQHSVALIGPFAEAAEAFAASEGRPLVAPWGGELKEQWTPFDDESKSVADVVDGKPLMVRGATMPACLNWVWRYARYKAVAWSCFSLDDGAISLDAARAVLAPIANALHQGVLAEGLAGEPGTAATPRRFRAQIEIPPLRPGEVLSPSVQFVDQDGQAPREIKAIAWLINGRFTPSVVWDGQRAVVEVQATVDEQAVVAQLVVPAWSGEPAAPVAGDAEAETVPGIGGVGPLPGPADLRQALVGLLGPTLIGLIGHLASGRGGRGPTAPHKPRPPPPRRRKTEPRRKEGSDKTAPPARTPDDEAARVQAVLDRLSDRAWSTGSVELGEAVAKARREAIGPDGKLDPLAWREAQREIREALGKLHRNIGEPNGWVYDSLAAGVGAVGELGVGVVKGAGNLLLGLGQTLLNGLSGLQRIGEAILNPGTFLRGLKEVLGTWTDKHAAAERQAFNEALRDGRVGDALRSLGRGAVKGVGHLGAKAWEYLRKDVLPWDEISSFWDKNASWEERAWAIPAAALKIASLLTMRQKPTTLPSTRWGRALQDAVDRRATRDLAQAAGEAGLRAGRLEAQVKALERVAAGKRPPASNAPLLEQTRKALAQARELHQAAQAAHEVELLARQAMRGREAFQNFQQAQKALAENPELKRAIDQAIARNDGGTSLYKLRAGRLMGEDAHTLITARKLQLQDQAVNHATRRILQKEVTARLAAKAAAQKQLAACQARLADPALDPATRRTLQQEAAALKAIAEERIPRRFHTFNATQGSRSRISGSNIDADFDQTLLGLRHVSREEAEQIINRECKRLGMTKQQLDINIYRPRKGLMDAAGAAPNDQVTLENIGQTTGTAGHHEIYVGRDGKVHVGNHVSTAQGREGVLAGRATMDPPPGWSRQRWMQEGIWEGFEQAPLQVPKAQWAAVRATQLENLFHAFERGNMNQMVKYANRGRMVGLSMDESTARLVRNVAGQKDPAVAARILSDAGVRSPQELMARLGLKK